MSLTPPRLRRGSVPATAAATAGMGGATARPRLRRGVVETRRPLPPHPPAGLQFHLVAAGLAATHLLLGCSTTSPSNGVGPPALAGCPATVADANGSRCTEGLTCSPTYSCGAVEALATCVCAGGQFACTDVTGMPLRGGSTPGCPAASASETCPATETSASL